MLEPIPSMCAPIAVRQRARSCTCGSAAALRRMVRPCAATAAIRAFSVPVTLGSSRKMSAPLSAFASSSKRSPIETDAPSCSSARKWVSTRRRPMTSPPGGGRVTLPNRASIGPASRIDARMRAHSAGSSGLGRTALVSTRTAFGPVQVTSAPRSARSASIVSTSRMRGMLSRSTGPSASTVAARMGSAAFLLPAGRMVPCSGRPPRTRKRGGMAKPCWGRYERQARSPVVTRANRALCYSRPSLGSPADATRRGRPVMPMLAYLQVAAATPAWVGPTMAISLAFIALAFIAIAFAVVVALAKVRSELQHAGRLLSGVQDDVRSAAKTVRNLTEQGQELLVMVRHEAGAFAQTSRRLRRKVVRGMDRVEERLEDLDALYGVVHEEVEDSALDVAAALRSFRRGDGMIGRVRRLLVPGR